MAAIELYGTRSRCLISHLPIQRRSCRFCCFATREKKDKVIVISGPTGAGKSRIALELAKRLNGEIISADSVQIYRGLDVGSAKPSLRERKEVPHHLIDILNPWEDYSAGQFFEDARQATHDILKRDRVPIVTGGTGLYLRWFIYGKPDVPKASLDSSSDVYLELEEYHKNGEWDAAVDLLVKAGDLKAKLLASNDWYRLRRSLEIIKATGSPPSDFKIPYNSFKDKISASLIEPSTNSSQSIDEAFQAIKSTNLDFDYICFFISSCRHELYRAIDKRCESMLSGNKSIFSESKCLLDMGLLPNSNSATRAIGYRQAMEYLLRSREQNGRSSPADFFDFLSDFQKASRNFAKRQLTWFRNEHMYSWLDASQPLDKLIDFICETYRTENGKLTTPDFLKVESSVSSRVDALALKAYRAKNTHFKSSDDCMHILEWIKKSHDDAACML